MFPLCLYFSLDQFGLSRSNVQGPILNFSYHCANDFHCRSNSTLTIYLSYRFRVHFSLSILPFDKSISQKKTFLFLTQWRGEAKKHYSYALQTHHSNFLHSSTSPSLPQCKLKLANDLKSHFPKWLIFEECFPDMFSFILTSLRYQTIRKDHNYTLSQKSRTLPWMDW